MKRYFNLGDTSSLKLLLVFHYVDLRKQQNKQDFSTQTRWLDIELYSFNFSVYVFLATAIFAKARGIIQFTSFFC